MTETKPDGETARPADDETARSADEASDPPEDSTGTGATDRSDERSDTNGEPLGTGVVTIANDRSLDSDPAGEAIVTALTADGHEIVTREHIGSDHDRVQSIVSRMIDRDDIDVIVTGGATSVEPDDVTLEAVEPLLDKELTAFDELFTSLAHDAVGTRALTVRTLAGIADCVPVFCLPGNEDAARLGLEEIILPEAIHLVELAREEIDEGKWGVDDPESEAEDRDGAEDGDGAETSDGTEAVDRSEPADGAE